MGYFIGVEQSEQLDLGKKVFFLYPPSVVKASVVMKLIEQEFEVLLLNSHTAASRLLRSYPNAVIFINIDEGQNEKDWRTWIQALLADERTKTVGVGILSYNTDDELARFYLMELGVRCGFVKLKLGVDASLKILIDTLNVNEVKGRRKYIRANCARDPLATLNIKHNGAIIQGRLKDMSIVGFSCAFEVPTDFVKNEKVSDIQLKMRGVLLSVEAVVFGSRNGDGETVYVMMFASPPDEAGKEKIRKFIQVTLQAEIDLKIAES